MLQSGREFVGMALDEPWVDKRFPYVCWRMELGVLLDEPWVDKKRD